MAASIAQWLLYLIGVYAGIGLVVAAVFSWRGVARVDPAARGAHWGFRLLILPGAAALWPLVVRWWVRAARASIQGAGGSHA